MDARPSYTYVLEISVANPGLKWSGRTSLKTSIRACDLKLLTKGVAMKD